jgi:DNA sulfur modification protein DndD
MCNFFNYAGDYDINTYEFNAGLNVIVAENGGGKSKLFSAFCWILKDEVVDSDASNEKNVPVKLFMERMISDLAKVETMINSEVICGVRINFTEGDYEYEVTKSFLAKKLSESDGENEMQWSCQPNEPYITKKNLVLLDYLPIGNDEDERNRIIHKIIKPEFLKYALLQGEEVDNILNFENTDSLASALNTITDTAKIELLITTTQKLAELAAKDLTSHQKSNAVDQNKFNSKAKERADLKIKLSKYEGELSGYKERLTKAKLERDKLMNILVGAEGREKVRLKQVEMKKDLENLDYSHAEFLNKLNDRFFDEQHAWLLYNTGHYESSFHQLRDQYVSHQNSKRLLKNIEDNASKFPGKLPDGSPDSFSLRRMLEEGSCYVCGREAPPHSDAWKQIESILAQHTPKKKTESKQNFSELLDKLMKSASSYYNQISSVEEGLKNSRLSDKEFRNAKSEKRLLLEEANNELIGLGGSKSEDDKDKFTVNKYGEAERQIEKYEASIRESEYNISDTKQKLEIKEREITELSGGKTKSGYLTRKEMMEDIEGIALSAKKILYLDIVKRLQDKSNEFFNELTRSGPSKGGSIRITQNSDESFSVEIINSENNRSYGLSEGFQRMKKLAVIMAIIAASERGRLDYPLIADAPLSSFGIGFIKAFFETVPGVFEQSIIMVKELYDSTQADGITELGHQVLTKIRSTKGSFHLNIVPKDEQERRLSETIIKRY